jgi:hypothetical protein
MGAMAAYLWWIMALVPRGGLAQTAVAIRSRVVVCRSGSGVASVEGRADRRQGGAARRRGRVVLLMGGVMCVGRRGL